MSSLLDQAFDEPSQLQSDEQDALAAIILAEIRLEKRWSDTFAKSQNVREQLANDALIESQAGK